MASNQTGRGLVRKQDKNLFKTKRTRQRENESIERTRQRENELTVKTWQEENESNEKGTQ